MTDTNTLESLDGLRAIIGEPHELVTKKIVPYLDDMAHRFIAHSPYVMLSTASKEGVPDVSPRGDGPGFAYIADNHTLYLPERQGNKLAFSLQNILENPNVALMFIIPGVDEAYRVHGTARIINDPVILERLTARGQPALLALEIKVKQSFLHCGKAMKRSQLWKVDPKETKMSFRFGATVARESGGGDEVAKMVDQLVEEDYRDNL
ncbi:MSMEG_1061 family FMN-dependent PPOX-type flavoprotein [Kordiimonas pumila]|uniref:MSMEG_1061 family FMN-dependent PPOX-type flavoprotein n=1 Tax=Kordiimonas pumila TaxID=2161677 RepID=A0ABV7D5K7_9PROT|nr:MSMEG_1061 family FMN-dependent PPOX-type flavoprotein [Kordiimonas pumila]